LQRAARQLEWTDRLLIAFDQFEEFFLLREAARQEAARVIVRPIAANLLGVVLRRTAGYPPFWQQKGDLLAALCGTVLVQNRKRSLRLAVYFLAIRGSVREETTHDQAQWSPATT
jgi:hypothetical protein